MIKQFFIIIVLIVSFSGCAARQPWTKTDKTMFATATAANMYDFYTTNRYIESDGRMRDEWQWLYGSNRPSTSTLALSKIAQMKLAWVVLDRTPSKWRKPILILMTGTWVFYGIENN